MYAPGNHADESPFSPHEEPPQAALCIFSKLCDTLTEAETRLAAWQFLPPELQEDKRNPYN